MQTEQAQSFNGGLSIRNAWKRLLESKPVASWFGTSWRKLHSPTLYQWARALQPNPKHWPKPVAKQRWSCDPAEIERLRQHLARDVTRIQKTDLGAGSRTSKQRQTHLVVGAIARQSLTPREDIQAMCRWLSCVETSGRFLELGTSLGTTSAMVAALGWSVETWEGCPQTLEKAKEGWKNLGLDRAIDAKLGDFAKLAAELGEGDRWDVVYLDGCHKEEATMSLVKALEPHTKVALVVDDIAWSREMHRAWQFLQSQPVWRVSFSWRGRGFLLKAPHMSRQQWRLS